MKLDEVKTRVSQDGSFSWRIHRFGPMRVDGVVYATKRLWRDINADECLVQVANVASLPGIVGQAMAMPDIHWGYGFPIGGVAAFSVSDGVISPGGVGYDINCGVRVMATQLTREEVMPRLSELLSELARNVPSGVGSARKDVRLDPHAQARVLSDGALWALANGYGEERDGNFIEDGGRFTGADPAQVSDRACERGRGQLGTLGSGNHFVEVSYVDAVFDAPAAKTLGLAEGMVTVSIHTGSRGLGYQVCDDFLVVMRKAAVRYGIDPGDPQLCCAPVGSPEGKAYLGAMYAAGNFAFANRQMIGHFVRESFLRALHTTPRALGMRLVYDLAHNIAKIETHRVKGKSVKLCVHRKGATRSFGPGRAEVPEAFAKLGQPVLVPGDMGRASYILLGTERAMEATFGSTCHGAGRVLSRHAALKAARGRSIAAELESRGILVAAASRGVLAEEMPEAYKDVEEVVEAVCQAGLNRKVARLRPLAVLKG